VAENHGIVDLAELGPELFTGSPRVDDALATVVGADLLIVASPTYKATYTGLLKVFLDRLPARALAGRAALPLMVTGSAAHALAVEVHLRPLLVELGATVPTPGLALTEAELADAGPRLEDWIELAASGLRWAFTS
jgi:FMN reductase